MQELHLVTARNQCEWEIEGEITNKKKKKKSINENKSLVAKQQQQQRVYMYIRPRV
jgi:hypothetical protein